MAEERALHEQKMAKMEAEMKMVFQQKVQEKEAKLKQSEEELYARHREMRDALEKQRLELEDKKRRLESGRPLTPTDRSAVSYLEYLITAVLTFILVQEKIFEAISCFRPAFHWTLAFLHFQRRDLVDRKTVIMIISFVPCLHPSLFPTFKNFYDTITPILYSFLEARLSHEV
jgi:hypothetical protein